MADDTTQAPKDLIGFLDFYLVKKAPFQLPDAAKEWIVKFGPWITVVIMILLLPPLLAVMGIGTMLMPFAGYAYASSFTFAMVFLVIQLGFMVAALPGLFARKMAGWTMSFYGELVGILFSLLSGSIVGGLLGGLIGLYILFQIRPLYTK